MSAMIVSAKEEKGEQRCRERKIGLSSSVIKTTLQRVRFLQAFRQQWKNPSPTAKAEQKF
jgi:hypothetical protein